MLNIHYTNIDKNKEILKLVIQLQSFEIVSAFLIKRSLEFIYNMLHKHELAMHYFLSDCKAFSHKETLFFYHVHLATKMKMKLFF